MTVIYAYVIAGQEDVGLRPWLVGASLLFASLVLFTSTLIANARARLLLLSLGTWTLLIWTVLGAFSIGVLLLPAALLALFSTGRTTRPLSTPFVWAMLIIGAAASLLAVTGVLAWS